MLKINDTYAKKHTSSEDSVCLDKMAHFVDFLCKSKVPISINTKEKNFLLKINTYKNK